MELYGRIKPCTAACAPSSIVQRSIAETISLKSNFAVVWEALQLYERRVTVLKKPGWYGASNQQAIYGALMRTYIHSACYDGAQSMANSITSIFFFLVQVIAIYCAVFIAIPFCPSFPSCTIVENWIIKFGIWIRGRKHSIWYMRVW